MIPYNPTGERPSFYPNTGCSPLFFVHGENSGGQPTVFRASNFATGFTTFFFVPIPRRRCANTPFRIFLSGIRFLEHLFNIIAKTTEFLRPNVKRYYVTHFLTRSYKDVMSENNVINDVLTSYRIVNFTMSRIKCIMW